jgi:hypothetical protein
MRPLIRKEIFRKTGKLPRRDLPGWPPRFRPEGGFLGRAATLGGSLDGGLDEFLESIPRRACRAAT